jgi:single-stranded-DNA-specific exonuclease
MLTTDDSVVARTIASELDRCNTMRQEVEQSIVAEARAMVEQAGGISGRGAIIVAKEGWHAGVIGIVASRLAELYHRPSIVVALHEGHGQGSARSVAGLNLHDAIAACSEGLTGFGGHAAAAGLKLPAALLPSFAERFDRHCREILTSEQLERVLHIDAEVPLGILTTRQVKEIDSLEPYGSGNPRPMLVVNRVRLQGDPKIVGARQNHAQLRVAQGELTLKAVAWNMAERCRALKSGMLVSLAFQPSINEWNGRREVQLEVKDFQVDVDVDEAADHASQHAPP